VKTSATPNRFEIVPLIKPLEINGAFSGGERQMRQCKVFFSFNRLTIIDKLSQLVLESFAFVITSTGNFDGFSLIQIYSKIFAFRR
jgi:hypothetical protein